MKVLLEILSLVGRLLVFYAGAGLIGAALFVAGATAYVFPGESALFAGGAVFAFFAAFIIRRAVTTGWLSHINLEGFFSPRVLTGRH